jgi:ribosome-binding protein aMBF1 (putative translation factor)
MEHQDWTPVVLNASNKKHSPPKGHPGFKKIEDAEGNPIKPKTYGKEYGQRVILARNQKGLNQADLAKAMNVQPIIVKEIENGTGIVNDQNCQKIYKLLGVKRNV